MSYYKRYRTSCLKGRFFTCQGNSASSCWSILFFTVERKGYKREKFEGNIVRIFGVVFSVEDKNVLSNRQMDRASKSSLPDLLPKSTGCVGLGMQVGGPKRAI